MRAQVRMIRHLEFLPDSFDCGSNQVSSRVDRKGTEGHLLASHELTLAFIFIFHFILKLKTNFPLKIGKDCVSNMQELRIAHESSEVDLWCFQCESRFHFMPRDLIYKSQETVENLQHMGHIQTTHCTSTENIWS